ncbi:gamma-glutamyltransferase [Lysinibacillus sp. BW-2-10]|uniref:gamma-glutamyltransferase n=1 Tax=Lysinibacillus sp. BW-2-10 TaxID=2590030 RepID=UPI00117CE879|nr:gamma-glutamyltransferase [Lysinibacillus sp. BW-2-10]TSI05958.1 gamma-glutamyltransferase [Lysinibacillus sp. BW-2-10]
MKQYRATTMSTKGMVTTPHYLASQAAITTLQKGGNAIEAAIAAASTIGVVYPHMNGIGGDNFWLIYNAKTKELKALNASGRSGEMATINFYKSQGYTKIPSRGALAANTVPGAVAGWGQAYAYSNEEMNGSLSWVSLLESAIHYAKEGFPVTPSQEYWTSVNLDEKDTEFRALGRYAGFKQVFLKGNRPYQAGDVMKQMDLAKTLTAIAENGANHFYNSELTEKVVADLQKHGGILTVEDFKKHTSDWVKPISVPYRDYVAYNLPPNTQGMASLSILNILNHINMKEIEEGSSTYYHVLVEAIKHAFVDRDRYLTDPNFMDIPISEILSEQHGLELAEKIRDSDRAKELQLLDAKGDTVWLGIVDEYGNAVSFIQSIYHEFGSGFIPEGTGIVLQNRGSYFSLDENHVNALAPRKRSFHTLNPAMLLKNGNPTLVYGTMGGEGQPQTQAALVTRIVDYGMNVQEAIEAPRWLYGRTWGASSNSLKVENRISNEVLTELKQLGHDIEVLEEFTDTMGHAGGILIDEKTNVKFGGADPRGDGMAIGY